MKSDLAFLAILISLNSIRCRASITPDYLVQYTLTYKEVTPANIGRVTGFNESKPCFQDWLTISEYPVESVLKYWDSYAYPASGILEGRALFLGQPEECANAASGFAGTSVRPFPDTETFLVRFSSSYQAPSFFQVGVCAPKSCSVEELAVIYAELVRDNLYAPPYFVSASRKDAFQADAAFVIASIVFGSLFLIVVLATIHGSLLRNDSK